ncbi:MAG: hypothetical protein ACRELY_11155 [Polyangiaceae bacterium]
MRFAAIFTGFCAIGLALACSSSSPDSSPGTSSDAGPDAAETGTGPTTCNGHAELCGRAYTAVAFPGDHDSYATVPDGFIAADQDRTVAQQLAGGVRVLHLEMQLHQGDAYLCHASCSLGNKLLSDELSTVAAFMNANPTEVVTLLMESQNLTTDQIAAAFDSTGLTSMAHQQPAGTPWSTLGDMIQKGDHLVVFLADLTSTGGTSFPWMLDRFARTWETPWNNKTPQDFARCDADRGTKGNDIYVVDTYREDTPVASTDQAMTVNPNPFLIDRLMTCKTTENTLPNFVMVNFYEIGDAMKDVDILNGIQPDPGEDLSQFPPQNWPGTDAGPADAGDDASDGG